MTEAKKPQAKITSRKNLYKGLFTVEELTIEMDRQDGGTQTVIRENFERGHAVGILPYDPKTDQVLLVNEMRPGMLAAGDYPFNDSLPAGMIDKGETQVEAATRETEEETGQALGNPRMLHEGAFVSAGGTTERLGLVYGTFDSTTAGGIHGKPGEGENIKSVLLSADEFIARGKDGRLKDMKSLVLSFWLALHHDELKDPDAKSAVAKPVDAKIGDVFAPKKPKLPQAEIVARETLYEGKFKIEDLTIEMDKHEGGKQTLHRLNFERGNSIAMLGYDAVRDEVVLTSEMRPGMLAAGEYPYNDSVPAAMLGQGEDAIAAAVKQMRRKTGLELGEPVVIHPGAYVTAGGSSEKIVLVVGSIDSSTAGGFHGTPGSEDDIKSTVVKSSDFIARAESGEIKDMKSLAFAFWLANNRKALQAKAAAAPKTGKDGLAKKISGLQ